MKNTETYKVIILPSEDESHLWITRKHNVLAYNNKSGKWNNTNHLYVISDEPIKEGDWYIDSLVHPELITKPLQMMGWCNIEDMIIQSTTGTTNPKSTSKKIIATTDKSLTSDNSPTNKIGEAILNTYIPQLPQSFIKHYAEVGGVDEVTLEMEKIPYMEQPSIGPWEYYYKLKLTDSNEVVVVEDSINTDIIGNNSSIHSATLLEPKLLTEEQRLKAVEMMYGAKLYSREEVIEILHSYQEEHATKNIGFNKLLHDRVDKWTEENL